MKKFGTMALALLLCLLMALPMGAIAEEAPAIRLDLTDPVVSMDGEPILDLTGLGLHLLGAVDEADENISMQLSVTGGDETALNAVAEIAGEKLLAKLDGMTNLYSAVIEKDAYLTVNGENLLENPAVKELESAAMALAMGELPDKLGNLIAEEGGKVADKVVYVGTESHEMISGEQEAAHVSLELTAEETTAIIEALLKLLDEDADFAAFMQALNNLAGEDVLEGNKLLDLYKDAGIGAGVVVDIYSGETGSAVEVALELTSEEIEEPGYVLWRMITEEYEDGGADFYTDIDLVEGDEPFAGVYFACSNVVEDDEYLGTQAEFGMGSYAGEDFVAELYAQMEATPVMIDNVETMKYTFILNAGEEAIAFSACGYAQDGEVYGELVLEAEEVSVKLSFDGATGADALLSGVLTGTVDMMGSQFAADVKVEVSEDTLELGALQGDAANAIALETMTGEQMEAAEMELMTAAMNCLEVLQNNVPGVQMIMSLMMSE